MTRESNKLSKLGRIASLVGFVALGITGFLNFNNLDKEETYVQCRVRTLYSMVSMFGASALILGGMGLSNEAEREHLIKENYRQK